MKLLEDPSKLVQRTAAWSLAPGLRRAPRDRRSRTARRARLARAPACDGARPASSPIISPALARRNDLIAALDRLAQRSRPRHPHAGDPRPVAGVVLERRRPEMRGKIEDTVLAGLAAAAASVGREPICARPSTTWPTRISATSTTTGSRCWASPEDRDRAIQGRLAVESQLAVKFAAVLEHGPDAQKKQLLAALAELPLRRGDAYDLAPAVGEERRRRSIAASATISSRSPSSARAPPCSPAPCCRCSIRPMRRCGRWRATPA